MARGAPRGRAGRRARRSGLSAPAAERGPHPLDALEQRVERAQPEHHARDPAVRVRDDAEDAVELQAVVVRGEDRDRLARRVEVVPERRATSVRKSFATGRAPV